MLLTQPLFFLIAIAILGLCVGSFLNVVIHRLPMMLQASWREQCLDFLNAHEKTAPASPTFNLAIPRSHCPKCQHTLRILENIPLFSFIFLRGKCHHCQQKISIRYPLVELSSGIIACFLAYHFGPSWQFVASLFFSWGLLALAVIDLDHQLLPDNLTLPLLWLGLFCSLFLQFVDSQSAIIGAIAGYLTLWSIAYLFQCITKKVGMGHGDFKLLAVLGAWAGWQALPFIVFLASLLGAIVGISLILMKKRSRHAPIPFGPALAFSGWIALIWGNQLNQWYWQWLS